jgi:hypothetical protein
VVVEVDVGEHRDLRPQQLERTIGLVAFRHEPSLPRPCVAAELRDLPSDEKGRIETKPVQNEGNHRRRRGLAVGARDDDRASQLHELREELSSLLDDARA